MKEELQTGSSIYCDINTTKSIPNEIVEEFQESVKFPFI